MKRIVTALLLLAVCFCTASCAKNKEKVPDGMKLASGEDDAYFLYIPQDWTATDGYQMRGAFYSAADTSNVNVTTYLQSSTTMTDDSGAVVTSENAPADKNAAYIDAYWYNCQKESKKVFTDFTVIEDGIEMTLGEFTAKKYIYTAKIGGVECKVMMVVTYYGGLMYIVTYTAQSEKYDSHTADVEKMITEFKFKR